MSVFRNANIINIKHIKSIILTHNKLEKMKHVFFFLALLVAVAGCKSKQKLVKSEFIEKQTIDTIQVPAERSTLTGTLSYIPGTGIVFTGIDQKQTPGIATSVSISGDTLKVETRTQEKNIPVVTASTTVENKYVEEQEKNVFKKIMEAIGLIIVLFLVILLIRISPRKG